MALWKTILAFEVMVYCPELGESPGMGIYQLYIPGSSNGVKFIFVHL